MGVSARLVGYVRVDLLSLFRGTWKGQQIVSSHTHNLLLLVIDGSIWVIYRCIWVMYGCVLSDLWVHLGDLWVFF